MARPKRKTKKGITTPSIGPTPEQTGNFVTVSLRGEDMVVKMVYSRLPVIDRMRGRNELSEQEHRALAFYRDQAQLAERSPTKSCLDDSRGGGEGDGLGAAVTSAIITTARIERDLGSLLDIARAVAVDDISLSQWCIAKHGGRERYDDKGRFVALVPIAEKRNMGIARLELRHAASRIVP